MVAATPRQRRLPSQGAPGQLRARPRRVQRLHGALAALALWASLSCGCVGGRPPVVEPLPDQVASVGVELVIEVRAKDPDGSPLTFDFAVGQLPDLRTREQPATLTAFADGVAIFRWTPQPSDRARSPVAVDFRVSDGTSTVVETVQVAVRDGTGAAPLFRQPLGTGTSVDLEKTRCVTVELLADDPDSTAVTFAEEAPRIPGATFTPTGAFTARWTWCPTPQQIAAQERWLVTWSASDGENPTTRKTYLIVLRRASKGACPGDPPAVTHTPPGPQATVHDLTLTIDVTDDEGVKGTPFVYWSTSPPVAPIDLSKLVQTAFKRTSGDARAGTYQATLPNPVAALPAGAQATLYYLISASDENAAAGCAHETLVPVATPSLPAPSYTVEITSAPAEGAAPCAPCTADSQCGGEADHCIVIGPSTACGRACSGGDCPAGFACSAGPVASLGGRMARQCLPASGRCGDAPTLACVDDRLEDNDGRTAITNATAAQLGEGPWDGLMFCPAGSGADEDWYGVRVLTDTILTAGFTQGIDMATDLDLQLVDDAGNVLERSYSSTPTEQVSRCVPAGSSVYLRVFTFDLTASPTPYSLGLARAPATCVSCTDPREPDDSAASARSLGSPVGTTASFSGTSCTGNDDWFAQYLLAGDTITVDLDILSGPGSAPSDLDLHLYLEDPAAPGGATDLTPCPPCDENNGQSLKSSEHLQLTAPTPGQYYVVVRPFGSAATSYALRARIAPK